MTQEDKDLRDLLLKDLCARLPYGVKCKIYDHNYIICDISFENQHDVFYKSGRRFHIGVIGVEENGRTFYIDVYEKLIKPYLFPLSSMTKEQMEEFIKVSGYEAREEDCGRHTETYYYDLVGHENVLYPNSDGIDWLNKNHFDYRGLIEKGLAIDATGLNVY